MKTLTPTGFTRARDFLLAQARPLEKAFFSLGVEGGTVVEVLTELEKFQNQDGGRHRENRHRYREPG